MNGEVRERRWSELRWWEILILLGLMALTVVLFFLPALSRGLAADTRAACQNNLRQLAMACAIYAEETPGRLYPPVQLHTGRYGDSKNTSVLMVHGPALFPDYFSDAVPFVCPSKSSDERIPVPVQWLDDDGQLNPQAIDDSSYIYTGWSLDPGTFYDTATGQISEAAADAFLRTMRSPDPALLDLDIVVGDTAIPRLRASVPPNPAVADDAVAFDLAPPNPAPVFFDTFNDREGALPWNHARPGANVVYTDGHAEFIEYPSTFPCIPAWPELYRRLKTPSAP